jgi:hypothetical protein
MSNIQSFLKRHPGAANLGLLYPNAGNQNKRSGTWGAKHAMDMAIDTAAVRNRQRLRKFLPWLNKLAHDAIAQVKQPMEEGDEPYGENPDTPQKQVAHHTIKAAQQVGEFGPEDPDVNEICAHLQAAMQAAQNSPRGHEIMPHLQALHKQIAGADPDEDDSVGDSDPYNKRF